MSQRLVLRLQGASDGQYRWLPIGSDGRPDGPVTEGSLSDAARLRRPLVVLAPAADVALFSTPLPRLSRQRAARAVPYALEDQLVEDVLPRGRARCTHRSVATLPLGLSFPIGFVVSLSVGLVVLS